MKHPNGYGSIIKMSGSRRKPWRVRKTIGWDLDEATGKKSQKYQTIGYYATRPEAIKALADFNENPYSIETNTITFSGVYEKWSTEHYKTVVEKTEKQWKSIYNIHCLEIHDVRFRDLKVSHLEAVINNCKAGDITKGRIRNMFNMMYRYAIKHEITEKNYADMCNTIKEPQSKIVRTVFTDNELKTLWENTENITIKTILISLYSGWRPTEIAELKTENIDLDNKTMTGGIKTDAGINRTVPIHNKILPLIVSLYNEENQFLITDNKGSVNYDTYYHRFKRIMDLYGYSHSPHDTRHSFVTYAKDAGINEYVLKLIVGHSIEDITEKVYTHRTLEQLCEEINKITV